MSINAAAVYHRSVGKKLEDLSKRGQLSILKARATSPKKHSPNYSELVVQRSVKPITPTNVRTGALRDFRNAGLRWGAFGWTYLRGLQSGGSWD